MQRTEATQLAREILATGAYTILHTFPVDGMQAWNGEWNIQIQNKVTGRKSIITNRQQWEAILYPVVIREELQDGEEQ